MKLIHSTPIALFALLAVTTIADDDLKTKIVGKWEFKSMTVNGQQMPASQAMMLEFKAGGQGLAAAGDQIPTNITWEITETGKLKTIATMADGTKKTEEQDVVVKDDKMTLLQNQNGIVLELIFARLP